MKNLFATLALVCMLLAIASPADAAPTTTPPAFHMVFQGTALTSGTIKTTPIWCYQACVFPPPPPCTPGGVGSPSYCLQDIDALVHVSAGETAATIALDTLGVLNHKKRLIKEYSFQISPTNSAEIDATPQPSSQVILVQVHFESYPAGVSQSWFLDGSSPTVAPLSAPLAPLAGPGFQITSQGPALGEGPIQPNQVKVTVYWTASGQSKSSVVLVAVGSGDSASTIAANTVSRLNARGLVRGDFAVQVSPTDPTTVVASPNPASNVTAIALRVEPNVEGVYETWYATNEGTRSSR